MSKDKGSKNHKKAPADKTLGKAKPGSDYKSEGKKDKQTVLEPFVPKADSKSGASRKS